MKTVRPLLLMVIIAFALRMAVVAFLYDDQLDPDKDHWVFAHENGRVARSIATGQGFANPQIAPTGPTALVPPVFPYLLAGVFKLFGVYSKASAIVILAIQSFFSALTCVPVFLFAKGSFGERVGKWAAWGWALFPHDIYFATDWVWPTCMTTLLLSVLFLMSLHLEGVTTWWKWTGFGVLYGLAALTDPIALSVLPLLGGWAAYRLYRQRRDWFKPAAISAVVFLVVVSPWVVRNYATFHQFIPFRDGFGLELYIGNNGYTENWVNPDIFPSHHLSEIAEIGRLGEIEYMRRKMRLGVQQIEAHPASFVWLFARRFFYIWTGYWSFSKAYLREEPLDPPNIVFNTVLTLLMLIGLYLSFRHRLETAFLYLGVLLCFPLVYCVTHPDGFYRLPIDTMVVGLAAYAVVAGGPRIRERLTAWRRVAN